VPVDLQGSWPPSLSKIAVEKREHYKNVSPPKGTLTSPKYYIQPKNIYNIYKMGHYALWQKV